MAEANFNDFGVGASMSRGAAMGRMMNLAGAAATLALVIGVAVWGYRLAVRDALGVPVIQAIEGPMRSAPSQEDVGGRNPAHAGLSVNRIAAQGTAGEVPEQIMLAEPPVELQEDDVAGIGPAVPAETARAVIEQDSLNRTLALAEELARQAAAEVSADLMAEPAAVAALMGEPAVALPAHVVQRSPRPMPRPGRAAAADPGAAVITGAETVAAALPGNTEIQPDAVPAGTRLAQIGAFDDVDTARTEWQRIADLHPALFEGKSRVIQPANSVGRTFYRLRVAGFASEDDSRRFCRAVEAGDLRCIPVTTR